MSTSWPVVASSDGYPQAGKPFLACRRLLEEVTGRPWGAERGCFADLVPRGGTVVVKPNLVRDTHPHGASGLHSITTHPAVTAAVVEAASLAVGRMGSVIVCDTPLQSADFGALRASTGLDRHLLASNPGGARLEVLDLRTRWFLPARPGIPSSVRNLSGDPSGYQTVDLGGHSKLLGLEPGGDFAVGDYDPAQTAAAHRDRHVYVLSRTVLGADLIVSVSKLKTHCKVGMTGALKNFIGVCGEKSFLPHFRRGSPASGGDEFASNSAIKGVHRNVVALLSNRHPRTFRALRHVARPTLRFVARLRREDAGLLRSLNGSWPGNDTLWRTVHDVHAATLYWADGRFDPGHDARRILHVMDAVVSGQGHGPLLCEPLSTGRLLAGWDPVAMDFVGAVLLGIDPLSLPVLARALDGEPYHLGLRGVSAEAARAGAEERAGAMPAERTDLPAGWESVRSRRGAA